MNQQPKRGLLQPKRGLSNVYSFLSRWPQLISFPPPVLCFLFSSNRTAHY
uniref:Uncharacterized protein n=1 Tax=Rhizophora mucronata TaxID=61149 RepID=A0A2P2P5R8_RHIMU